MTEHLNLIEVKEKFSAESLIQSTLCFLLRDDQVLLAMKKKGLAAGKWNGSGGKAKPEDESIEATARRETFEETDVVPRKLKKVAILNFYHFSDKGDWGQKVTVFLSHNWNGNPAETEEMAPKWFNVDEIPYDEMWEDDVLWLPMILSGKIIEGDFLFDENQKMLEQKVVEIA